MTKLKSARHHWWPQCVSRFWADENGTTGWLKPDGSVIRIPPDKLGMIGNAHLIKLGRNAGETTDWDSSFENEFDAADRCFPSVISWLESLDRKARLDGDLRARFLSQPGSDQQLRALTESVVSLAVRCPMNREASVALAERLRGPLASTERNTLIGANMAHSQRIIADSIGANAKFAVLFSVGREFVFGDGFFHNVTAIVNPPHNPKILAPITPTISVIVTRPMSYVVEPRLSTIILTDEEVHQCNHAVQVYSRGALFFRSQRPAVNEAFASGRHLVFTHPDNPIDSFIRGIPGVPLRDSSLDYLMKSPV
jgi:hypothetical protein